MFKKGNDYNRLINGIFLICFTENERNSQLSVVGDNKLDNCHNVLIVLSPSPNFLLKEYKKNVTEKLYTMTRKYSSTYLAELYNPHFAPLPYVVV